MENSKSQILPSLTQKKIEDDSLRMSSQQDPPIQSSIMTSFNNSKIKMIAGRSPYVKMFEQEEELCKLSKNNPKYSQSQKTIKVGNHHMRDKSKSYKTSGGIFDLIKQDRMKTEGYVSQSADFKILKKQYLRTQGTRDHVQHSIDKIERLKRKLQKINEAGGVHCIPEQKKVQKTPKGFFGPKMNLKTTQGSILAFKQSSWSNKRLRTTLNRSVLVKNSPPRAYYGNAKNHNTSLLQAKKGGDKTHHLNSFVLEFDSKFKNKFHKDE